MKIFNFKDMIGGWFVGDFKPTAFKTKEFEVSYKIHPKKEKWDFHYHTLVTEINLLIRGDMILQGKKLKTGDIFLIEPYEIADPDFLEDCEIVCVKCPSVPNDKIKFNVIN